VSIPLSAPPKAAPFGGVLKKQSAFRSKWSFGHFELIN